MQPAALTLSLPFFHPARAPAGSKIKDRMVFASSKDALRRSLVGIAAEVQGSDEDEVAYSTGMHHIYLLDLLIFSVDCVSWIVLEKVRGK